MPARPKNVLMKWAATATAIGREVSYPQLTPIRWPFAFKLPPIGTVLLLVAYLAFILALEFINNDVAGAQYNTGLGVRAAWLAVAQIPLLVLLVGKNNIIGLFTGISYERLNVLHRWVSRVLFLLASMHFGFLAYSWRQYHVFELEWTTDSCVPTGLATWVILLWMNVSTLAPFRNFSYEFFVVQHIITFFGFIIAVAYHMPSTATYALTWTYIAVAFYLVDRLIRAAYFAYRNRKVSRATLTKLDGNVTKIHIHNPRIKTWSPGSHVLVSFPGLAFGQNHPATIASTPKSHNGNLLLLLKTQKGFTKRLMSHANDSSTALLSHESVEGQKMHPVLLDGPYGGTHPDFAAFDSVLLMAGSTGMTFILPILLDLAERAESTRGKLPLRRVHVVWCIKQSSHALWVQAEHAAAFAKLRKCGVESDMSFFVTCADAVTSQTQGEEKECPCACDKSLGPCCCVRPADEDEKDVDLIQPLTGLAVTSSSSSAKDPEKADDVATSSQEVDSESVPSPTTTRVVVESGRPHVRALVVKLLDGAAGESGIAVCGPLGLSKSVRNAIAAESDRRAIHKGTGAQGVFLHVEGFAQ